MSVDLMRLCWRVEFPSAAMSAVAVKLADCANDDGENVYPSVGRVERETRLSERAVRKCLAIFEECGLLEVVQEAHGNKWNRSTTIRRFNMQKLHELSAVEQRGRGSPRLVRSTHVMREIADDAGGTCWRIVPRGPADPSSYPVDETATPAPYAGAPLHQVQGQTSGTPAPYAGGPLHQVHPTPAPGAPNPSKEPSISNSPHPPKGGESEDASLEGEDGEEADDENGEAGPALPAKPGPGRSDDFDDEAAAVGWARGWSQPARDMVDEIRRNGLVNHVALDFIDLVRGTQRPQKSSDSPSYVRQLVSRLKGYPAPVLRELARVMLDTRGGYLPDAATVARTAATIAVRANAMPPKATGPLDADAALAARWADLRAALVKRIGQPAFASWYASGVGLQSLEAGTLVLAADTQFRARWISQHHAEALTEAAREVFGAVASVRVQVAQGAVA